MKVTVKVPKLGLTTENVVLSEFVKAVGDEIVKGETIATLEADKASVDVEAPMGGRLIELLAEPGAELAIGNPLAIIET
ncbi:biotin attachment protein [Variovorax sp. WS11]|uniref:biotin/lipoyl-containing protein n=1 Tax=Variovorax sp. WS11 TaxID=1105204 RepID=UPI000D0D8135|nr:lipoyl domain-containing protein [Variovorax sp. WS11]NDZ17541.1 biotin attachment protein [Variovorax sp. WS11]PSL82251.1 biotin attachment protein [Variovorax sp. WS11]